MYSLGATVIHDVLLRQLRVIQKSKFGSAFLPHYYSHYFFRPKAFYFPRQSLVYMPIQKVANTSIRRAFRSHLGANAFLSLDRKPNSPYEVVDLVKVSQLKESFKFSFVRNPLDRLVSCYKDKVASQDEESLSPFREYGRTAIPFLPSTEFYPAMPFEEFVQRVCEIPDKLAERHFRSQHCFLYYKGSLVFDFIGKFESLEKDWEVVRSHLDLGKLPQKNESKNDDYRKMYTTETATLAAHRYAKDIALFDYTESVKELLE